MHPRAEVLSIRTPQERSLNCFTVCGGLPPLSQSGKEESMSISISSHQLIRQRAYEIFLERRATGRKNDAVSDWLEAEQEIRKSRIPIQARMLPRHFAAAVPLNLSAFRPRSPHLAYIRNPVLRPA